MTGVQLPLPLGDPEPPPDRRLADTGPLPPLDGPDSLIETIVAVPNPDSFPRLADKIRNAHLAEEVASQLIALVHPRARKTRLGGLWRERYATSERHNALRMVRLLQQPVEVAPVIAAIWDRDPAIRVDATETLGVIGLWLDWSSPRMQHIIHALKIALRHYFPDVRRAAALALARLSAYEATEALAARLEVEQDPAARQAVALVLGTLSDAGSVLPLLDSYEADEISYDVCFEALFALGGRAVEPLISVVRRWNVRVVSRQIAAAALGELDDRSAVEPLTVILGRPHEPLEIRSAAAVSLGKLGDRSALAMLHWVRREWGLESALKQVIDEAIARLDPPP